MRGEIGLAMLLVVATVRRAVHGQVLAGTGDWLRGLNANIAALNRGIQRDVQQLNRQIGESVRGTLEQIDRATANLTEDPGAGTVRVIGAGGGSAILSGSDGTKIVRSGRTSDGRPYVRETTDKIVGDTVRHVQTIYDPTTNVTRTFGYTFDLKDPSAGIVPFGDGAAP